MIRFFKIAILITFVFILSQCVLAGTLREDFSRPNMPGWKTYNFYDWNYDPDLDAGKWDVKDKKLYGSITESPWMTSQFLAGDLTWRYYTVSCRAKFIDRSRVTVTFGVILHARIEENRRYEFWLQSFRNKVSIVAVPGPVLAFGDRWKGGTQEWFDFDVKFDTWYSLTATAMKHGKLQFKIEDLTDPRNTATFNVKANEPIEEGGLAGFYVSNTTAVFDDIEVRGDNIPNGETFPIEPRSKLATTWGKLKRQ
jgi:hypothetical protein